VKSFLLSALATRYRGAPARFAADFPGDWLLWEPGAWIPPGPRTLSFSSNPSAASAAGASATLAMVLERGRPQQTLGRDESCDLTINDGTLSTRHLALLYRAEDGWTVEDLGSRNGTLVDGKGLAPGTKVGLKTGTQVVAAQVVLTFLGPEGLWQRIESAR
jgi:hypothetical protein